MVGLKLASPGVGGDEDAATAGGGEGGEPPQTLAVPNAPCPGSGAGGGGGRGPHTELLANESSFWQHQLDKVGVTMVNVNCYRSYKTEK